MESLKRIQKEAEYHDEPLFIHYSTSTTADFLLLLFSDVPPSLFVYFKAKYQHSVNSLINVNTANKLDLEKRQFIITILLPLLTHIISIRLHH